MFDRPIIDSGALLFVFDVYERASSGRAGQRRTSEDRVATVRLDVREMTEAMRRRLGRSQAGGDYVATGLFEGAVKEGQVLVETTGFLGTGSDGAARRLVVVDRDGTVLDGQMTLILQSLD